MRSTTWWKSSGSWVTTTTVAPRSARARSSSAMTGRNRWSMPVVGSSRRINRGSPTRARASIARCCSPPDNSNRHSAASLAIPTASSATSTRDHSARPSGRNNPRVGTNPAPTTSRTETGTVPGGRSPCGTYPMRRLTAGSVGEPPNTATRPACGASSPAQSRRIVDFPLPLGPASTTNCPAERDRSTPSRMGSDA